MAELKVVAIIQARMTSSRLPGKVLKDVCGRPLIARMLDRVRRSRSVDEIWVACSDRPEDEPLEEVVRKEGVACFRGSEWDILGRYQAAAARAGAEGIVRLTGDCPLMDPAVVDRVVGHFRDRSGEVDYVSNIRDRTYPDGLDVEAFSREALERAAAEAGHPYFREHVTPYLHGRHGRDLPGGDFRCAGVRAEADWSHLRWTVDEPEDLELVRRIFGALLPEKPDFSWRDVVALQTRDPGLLTLNRHLRARRGADRDWERLTSRASSARRAPAAGPRRFDRSNALFERASRRIPLASQTFSKSAMQYVKGACPLFLSHGKGGRAWDVDGNEYVDLVCGLLPVILGYRDPDVDAAVRTQLERGVTFSLATEAETLLAEELTRLIPCAEMVRYGKNGSDATSGAVRLARACTGRDHVAVCGYHGWQDWYIGSTSRHKGVPEAVRRLTHPFEYNDLDSLERVFADHPGGVAAVILEPAGTRLPAEGFLEGVRDLTRREGAVLIFDEIVTGFRWHLGGAQALYGVTPDLAAFGKGLANGFPLSAVVGRAELMREMEEVFFSGTFGGEAVSLAAALATVRKLEREKVVDLLRERGDALKKGIERRIAEQGLSPWLSAAGPACWPVLKVRGGEGGEGDEPSPDEWEVRSFIRQELAQRGVLVLSAHNLCYAHTEEDLRQALDAYEETFSLLRRALEAGSVRSSLRGEPARPVFAVR